MKKPSQAPVDDEALRDRAATQLEESPKASAWPETPTDAFRMLQELQILQIELEMQNEDLKQSKADGDAALEKYTDLYDFAPVGYFNLTASGIIQLVNLTGAFMAGVERSRLLGRSFEMLLPITSRHAFTLFLELVFSDRRKHSADFDFFQKDELARTVNIEARRLPNGLECRVVISDITERRRSADRVRLLWEAASVLLSTDEPEVVLQGLLAKIGPVLGVDAYLHYMVDESGGALRLSSCAGIPAESAREVTQVRFGESICGTVAEQRAPLHGADVQISQLPREQWAKSMGVLAYVCNPLLSGKVLLGTLIYVSRTRHRFAPEDLAVLKTIAHYVAAAYERRRGADAVRLSEIRYRRLFEAAHDGVLLLDPATHKVTDANPFMTRLLGYPRAELIGKKLFEIGLLKDEAASRDMLRKLKKNGRARYEDLPLESVGGRQQAVEVAANLYRENGRPVIQCNIRDITERKRGAEAVRQSGALFSALVAQSPVGVYVVDGQFRLIQINQKARAAFGKIRPLIGRDFSEIVHVIWNDEVADQIVARFRDTLKTGERYQSPEFDELRKDSGVNEIYEWQIQRVTLPAGDEGVVCFFDDVTDRVRAAHTRRRLDIMTASNEKLKKEIVRRLAVEAALKQSEELAQGLLAQSRQLQEKVRQVSYQSMMAQEELRKEISRELHDEISQLLVGINMHLAILTKAAVINPEGVRKTIAPLRRMVDESMQTVYRFSRELRPSSLDDLGLIPSLRTYIDEFPKRKGRQIEFRAFAGVEALSNEKRTVLYRVAQGALTNMAKHARASRGTVVIRRIKNGACLEISDNGRAFDVARLSSTRWSKRLGLTGMRERVEMVGGRFIVVSETGKGTTVRAEMPFGKRLLSK